MDSRTFEVIMLAVAEKLQSQAWTIENLRDSNEKLEIELAEYKKAELAAVGFGNEVVD